MIEATGVLRGRTRRALDSTLLDDAVATQDMVTQLISAVRRVCRVVAQAQTVSVSGHDYDSGAKPLIAWDDEVAKDELVSGLVNDALALLGALEGAVLDAEQTDALGLLALVAGQDVEPGESEGTWRIAQRVASDRVISTVDPETRHMRKSRSEHRDGYKAHIAVEPETGLITAAALTPANTAGGPSGVELLADEAPGLQILVDSAYGSGATRATLRQAQHRQAIKAIPLRSAVPGGFNRDDFAIDHMHRTVRCPAGHSAAISPKGSVNFRRHRRACSLRSRCTTAKDGMQLKIAEHDGELVEARRAWREYDFTDDYRRWRPMVERTIAWLVARGNRRVRYRGVQRNQLGLSLRVATINLRRLVNLGLTPTADGWILAGECGPGN